MTTKTTTEMVPGYLDVTRLAVAPFLARYREPTDRLHPGPQGLPRLVSDLPP